jgi:hypothetical protein
VGEGGGGVKGVGGGGGGGKRGRGRNLCQRIPGKPQGPALDGLPQLARLEGEGFLGPGRPASAVILQQLDQTLARLFWTGGKAWVPPPAGGYKLAEDIFTGSPNRRTASNFSTGEL